MILIYLLKNKINIKKILLFLIIPFVIIFLYTFINKNNSINLSEIIDELFLYSIREHAINYIKGLYSEKLSNFINLLLFSHKSESDNLYQSYIQLSIVHLLVVSGFHINVFIFIISKLLKKFELFKNILLIIFLFFFCYLNKFSLSITRAYLFFILNLFFPLYKNCFLDISIIIISIICPFALTLFGFQMSCLSIIAINQISKLKIKNKLINSSLITILINLYLLPYIVIISKEFSILFLLYSIIYTPIVSCFYVYILLFVPIGILISFSEIIFNLFEKSIIFFTKINIIIEFEYHLKIFWFIYLLSIYFITNYFTNKQRSLLYLS